MLTRRAKAAQVPVIKNYQRVLLDTASILPSTFSDADNAKAKSHRGRKTKIERVKFFRCDFHQKV